MISFTFICISITFIRIQISDIMILEVRLISDILHLGRSSIIRPKQASGGGRWSDNRWSSDLRRNYQMIFHLMEVHLRIRRTSNLLIGTEWENPAIISITHSPTTHNTISALTKTCFTYRRPEL